MFREKKVWKSKCHCCLFVCLFVFLQDRKIERKPTTRTSNEKRENGETGKRADQATHMMVNKLMVKQSELLDVEDEEGNCLG